jgi:hypothetical protein
MTLPRHLGSASTLLALALCGCGTVPPVVAPRGAATPPQELVQGAWNEVHPGGATICARGEPYAFWVWPGTSNRLVVDFGGGGACWSAATCDPDVARFSDDVDGVRAAVAAGYARGIYAKDRADNPFATDWHVLVPYCTGDVHWGDATVTYGEGADATTIHHRGAANARAALAYAQRAAPRAARVFVTGCSAGAYGSALWSAHVAQRWPDAHVIQLGDSGAGVITDAFFREGFPVWKAEGAFPSFIPELDPAAVDLRTKSLSDLYVAVSRHFPGMRMSQFNHASDADQLLYFTAMGGHDPRAWQREMLASLGRIEQAAPGFASFTVPGDGHCITPSDELYELEVAGVRFVDWLAELLERPVPSVRCVSGTCDALAATPSASR